MDQIIEINQLTKTYGNLKALDGVNLSLPKGKIIGILGPNGSGKTTLIKIITGMIKNHEGSVLLDNKPVSKETKALVAYLPDQLYFDGWMRIKDLKVYFKDMFSDFDVNKFETLQKRFKIEDRVLIKRLSKGNQEKLQLAMVLSRNAKIYIFDEPIGGVDPALREIILETIMSYRNMDATVLLSTHQIYDVERLFDEVVFLKEGKAILHRNTKELVDERGKSLLEIFKEEFKYVV
ncbi:MAG: ABC transporter ATP-binding protein [Acholeplasma sp.]|nr:ABC transporter ATP-binding protein [Acholeplasma sp.]